ncbi:MAG: DUF3810 domain-containing protein [Bacteroidetes bacterium]|nr:DUF3810 domain-containing protein [Bacteroidota bacterium]
MNGFPPIDRRFIWIGLGIFTFLLRYILSLNPYFTEEFYSRGLFAVLRYVWDYTLGWSPIPLIYFAFPLLLFFLIRWGIIVRKKRGPRSWRNRIAGSLLNILAFASGAIVFFFFLWGFNYNRVPVDEKLNLRAPKLTAEIIESEFEVSLQEMLEARRKITSDDRKADIVFEDLDNQLRPAVIQALKENGYPAPGRVRARVLAPNGLLMQLGASGIYIPFVFEGHVDGGLHPLTYPYTLAHEMAHGYGFGDEGTCNFWAYLACKKITEPKIRYAAMLDYWREVAVLYRRIEPEIYQEIRADLPKGLLQDIEAINESIKKYPGFFPEFSDQVYDSYLKNQGVTEGMASYGKVVAWVYAWRHR